MRSLLSWFLSRSVCGVTPIDELTGAPAITPPAGNERSCEFCGCRLTAAGEVLRMSDKARRLRTIEDRLLKEQEDHARTKGELSAAAQRVAELQAQLSPAPPAGSASGYGPSL